MAIRAKFSCAFLEEIKTPEGDKESETVTLHAVYGTDGTDNATWSKWTPAGTLSMTISNPEAFGQFVRGKEYFLDIKPAAGE